MSSEAWEQHYGHIGAEYIKAICAYTDLLKPLIEESGLGLLDINSDGIRILISFNDNVVCEECGGTGMIEYNTECGPKPCNTCGGL